MVIKAIFENGEFNPITEVKGVKEGEIVELILKKNIRGLEFIGMWKDRVEIKDGIDYVKKVRLWNRLK